jgi:hypothetical protein
MNVDEARARIKARVWQRLAKSDFDLKSVSEDDLETLISLVTDAALLEVDGEIASSLTKEDKLGKDEFPGDDDEQILWEGRPLLSLTTYYIITNERVRVISGILSKDREDVELIRVQDVDQNQTLRERLFSVGDITIHSHDPSDPLITLQNVKDPQAVHEILRRAVIEARKTHGLRYREEM